MSDAQDGHPEMAETIRTRIQARTHGQVRELVIELDDEEVVIQGRARTHYAKQLAQHGAMDFLARHRVINRIVVG